MRGLLTVENLRLHSAETRLRMTQYQIGTIEGRWKNFVPPIQGGIFRKHPAVVQEDSDESEDESADSDSTRATSFISDANGEEVRKRRGGSDTDCTSITSMLSAA